VDLVEMLCEAYSYWPQKMPYSRNVFTMSGDNAGGDQLGWDQALILKSNHGAQGRVYRLSTIWDPAEPFLLKIKCRMKWQIQLAV
jgi:hypothetical protein